jgi:hypothetical protein
MTKAKKTKASTQRTALDRITAQLRTVLRRKTTDIILVGNLLIEAREHLDHGKWRPYLAENFDLSIRAAQNYFAAAGYVARKKQIGIVADFANLSASVLYGLAAGRYNEQEEATILAATRKGRVDQGMASAICEGLVPTDDDDADADDGAQDDGGEDGDDEKEDAEIAAILDGPPPSVPPPAPNPPPPDFALRDFDQAISALNRLKTKPPTQFAQTIHSAEDLENVESFIRAVMRAIEAVEHRARRVS